MSHGILEEKYVPRVYCKAFEDNSGALELARAPKMRPRTKFIATKYHHFRSFVSRGLIQILPIDTLDQLADLYTKPLGFELFNKFTQSIYGWSIEEAIKSSGKAVSADEV